MMIKIFRAVILYSSLTYIFSTSNSKDLDLCELGFGKNIWGKALTLEGLLPCMGYHRRINAKVQDTRDNRGRTSNNTNFSSSHLQMGELTIKKAEYWRIYALKLWCWRRLKSPLYSKKFKPVNPKRNQPWIFTRRTDVEAETPILWPSDADSWFIWKDPDTGKDWGQEEKEMTEDEMVG